MTLASAAVATSSVPPRDAPNLAVDGGTWWHLSYTPATTYTASGDPIDIKAALPQQVRSLISVELDQNGTTKGYQGAYDATNKTVWLWNGTSEASGAISGVVFDMWVLAK